METYIAELSSSSKFNWRIENFSKLDAQKGTYSDAISVGTFNWKVLIYPKGICNVYEHMSIFLIPLDWNKLPYAEISFEITSQTDRKMKVRKELKHNFTEDNIVGWGIPLFIRLSELHDHNKGYIVNDTCTIEVVVTCRMKEDTKDDEDEGDLIEEDTKHDEYEGDASKEDTKDGEEEGYASDENPNLQILKTKSEKPSTGLIEYPGAGQPFGEEHMGFCADKQEFEDIGGFHILTTQAPLYRQIWLKYGHIPSIKVMPIFSYPILVMVVKDLMCSIIDMQKCHYVDLSSEMIDRWEDLITMAEKLEFNIGWLRERFEHVKKGKGSNMQNFKAELLEHGQHLRATKSKMRILRNVMRKVEAKLIASKDDVREKMSGLLSRSDMETYLEIGEDLLLEGVLDGVY
ncbi:MATH domain and coiled-coil domain-containing protein At3g58210-like [Papaver somniferum]|uniref:MATH domain and coiled-coil domain-containing protein At3g58210-like n=1 Tax=Papaver somniferum TaxID=3469 RepID=UPI000E700D9D|nr:MATH domain and coiled-coil domain-containing protein At3g58210-like [Papaver somniferum]